MKLDRNELLEEREWRTRNFNRSVQTIIRTMQDALTVEIKRILTWGVTYPSDQDIRHERTHADMAADIQHTLIQALNNCDFRGLTSTGSELAMVEKALIALDTFKAGLPMEIREQLEAREEERHRALIGKREHDAAVFAQKEAERCRAAVHESGRAVSFYQCTKKGKKEHLLDRTGRLSTTGAEGTELYRLCGTHVAELQRRGHVSIYRERELRLNIESRTPRKEIESAYDQEGGQHHDDN